MFTKTFFLFVIFVSFFSIIFTTPIYNENQKLIASDGVACDVFGRSVAIDGNNAVIGSKEKAYVYSYDGTNWTEQQILTASDGVSDDRFGYSVAISGNYIVVGADSDCDNGAGSGSTYIFYFDGTSWIELQKLTASDGTAYDMFGSSVSIYGNYIVVGAHSDDINGNTSGSAYIYHYNDTTWVEQQKLMPMDGYAHDHFGMSVSMSGDFAAIAAFGDNTLTGSVYMFYNTGTSWIEQQRVFASDGDTVDEFGWSVSLCGSNLLVGADLDDGDNDSLSASGSAYIFSFNGIDWIEQQKLTASDADSGGAFGTSVSISGNYAVVGAFRAGNAFESGAAYIYYFDGTNWIEHKRILASDSASGDYLGWAVSISGNQTFVGATNDDDNGDRSGSVYVVREELVEISNENVNNKARSLNIYPNPFNPQTNISYSVEEETSVEISVYNMKGQKVKTLVNKSVSAGDHSVVWHGFSESGKSVSSGVYFVKMTSGNNIEMRKIVLMK